jgi:hypothetical protein
MAVFLYKIEGGKLTAGRNEPGAQAEWLGK